MRAWKVGFGTVDQYRHQTQKHLQHSPSRNVNRNVSMGGRRSTGRVPLPCLKEQVAGFGAPPAADLWAPALWEGVE